MARSSFRLIAVLTAASCATWCASFATPVAAAEIKKVAIMTMVDTPQLLEVRDGVIKGLADKGYVEGKNLKIDFKSAQGNFGTAQQIARQFVGDAPDVIVSITTPVSQAVVAATKDVPVVFSTVTDAVAAKIVPTNVRPGGNVSGVTDEVPTELQMNMIREIVPNLKTLGLVYDSSQDSARATANSIKVIAPKMGFAVLEAPSMGVNNVAAATQSLVGRVDAIFVPNDTIVYAAFETVVKVAQDAQVPLFSAERRSVQRGSIGTVGFDFGEMGVRTAEMVDKVLKGAKPGDLDVVAMKDVPNGLGLYLNKASAEKMGVTLPKPLLDRALKVF
jgi:putative ABC transport system substrate-binding protein